MSPKAAVITVATLVVVVTLALVYGSVRPPAPPDLGRDALGSTLGRLVGGAPVTFADLAPAAGCGDPTTRTFVVVAGSPCRAPLPDGGAFALCARENRAAAVAGVDGRSYPAQTFAAGDLDCADPVTVRVYDVESTLTLGCAGTGVVCRFDLGPPGS